MPGQRSDDSSFLGAFGALIGAMSGGGDVGNPFPQSDSDDLMYGARFIPGNVTLARREGRKVRFVTQCGPCCWYWEFPDGTRTYHYDPTYYDSIGRHNHGVEAWTASVGEHGEHSMLAGACPDCGNEHTNGGTVEAPAKTS